MLIQPLLGLARICTFGALLLSLLPRTDAFHFRGVTLQNSTASYQWECAAESEAAAPLETERAWLPCADPAVSLTAAPCESACGSSTRSRSLRCGSLNPLDTPYPAVFSSQLTPEARAALLSQPCASTDSPTLPALITSCQSFDACTGLPQWLCHPPGVAAAAATSVSCAAADTLALGPTNGGYSQCPTAGCQETEQTAFRSVNCFWAGVPAPAAACVGLGVVRPSATAQCGPATADCAAVYPVTSPCVTDPALRQHVSCVPAVAPGGDSSSSSSSSNIATPFRIAVCMDRSSSTERPPSWCWPPPAQPPIQPCVWLPPCLSTGAAPPVSARWLVSPAGPCLSGPGFACRSLTLVPLRCEASYDSGTSWAATDVTVCQAHAPAPAPASVAACPSDPDANTACGPRGVCTLRNYVSPADGLVYLLARGECVCEPGYFGAYCELSLAVTDVRVRVTAVGGASVLQGSFRFTNEASGSTLIAARVPAVLVSLLQEADTPTIPPVLLTVLSPLSAYSPATETVAFSFALVPREAALPGGSFRVRIRVPRAAAMKQPQFDALSPTFIVPAACEGRCRNGGACVAATGLCACAGGWSGSQCEVSPCAHSGCNPLGSTCSVDPASGATACACTAHPQTHEPLYTGAQCLVPARACTDDPVCLNGGLRAIVAAEGGLACGRCRCPSAWSGAACGVCGLLCFAGGGVPNGDCGACVCERGYTGPNCGCRFATVRIEIRLTADALSWYREAEARVAAATLLDSPAALAAAQTAFDRAVRVWQASLAAEIAAAANGQLEGTHNAATVLVRVTDTTIEQASPTSPGADGAGAAATDRKRKLSVAARLYAGSACASADEFAAALALPVEGAQTSSTPAAAGFVASSAASPLAVPLPALTMADVYTGISRLVIAFYSGTLGAFDGLAGLDPAAGLGAVDEACIAAGGRDCPTGAPAAGGNGTGIPTDSSDPEGPGRRRGGGGGVSTDLVVIITVCCTAFAVAAAVLGVAARRGYLCFRKPVVAPQAPEPELETLDVITSDPQTALWAP